jgi:Xaa-Pro aminopeptidase
LCANRLLDENKPNKAIRDFAYSTETNVWSGGFNRPKTATWTAAVRRLCSLMGQGRKFCVLDEASDVVRGLRLVKSPTEVDHVRRAGRLADVEAVQATAAPGRLSNELAGATLSAMLAHGGDLPCEQPIVSASRLRPWRAGRSKKRIKCSWSSAPAIAAT